MGVWFHLGLGYCLRRGNQPSRLRQSGRQNLDCTRRPALLTASTKMDNGVWLISKSKPSCYRLEDAAGIETVLAAPIAITSKKLAGRPHFGLEGDAGEESRLFSEAELRRSGCARLHTWNPSSGGRNSNQETAGLVVDKLLRNFQRPQLFAFLHATTPNLDWRCVPLVHRQSRGGEVSTVLVSTDASPPSLSPSTLSRPPIVQSCQMRAHASATSY